MAGKQYTGVGSTNRYNPKFQKAFCEGMAYRASGTAAGKPKVNNPHISGSENYLAWNAGWDSADANKGGTLVPLNCGLGAVSVSA